MIRRFSLTASALLLVLAAAACAPAKTPTAAKNPASLRLAPLFGDHMVLQQGQPLKVWGWANPGEAVGVALVGTPLAIKASANVVLANGAAVADDNGKWMATLPATRAIGPCRMSISTQSASVTIEDILLGEVWLCSGQSNMQWNVANSLDAKAEIAAADHPTIRLYSVPRTVSPTPQDTCGGEWVACSPKTVPYFSAVGYFFGRELQKMTNKPIGLIHSSWGGTPAESWTTLPTLRADADFSAIVDRYDTAIEESKKPNVSLEEAQAAYVKAHEDLGFKLHGNNRLVDPGDTGSAKGYAKANFDDSNWKTIAAPGSWEGQGLQLDGVVWFRKTVTIPAKWAGKDLSLSLAAIDDYDVTYFNGVKVGSIGSDTANAWSTLRDYTVPAKLVTAGKATIAVRVFDEFGGGGFHGAPTAMQLTPSDGSDTPISLAGKWQYMIERQVPASVRKAPADGDPLKSPWLPSGLYNAMIHPLVPYTMRGAIWYQGESNASRAYQYRSLLPAMIADWRKALGNPDLAFGIVQLANYRDAQADPNNISTWAELREAQSMTAAQPHNGMAVIIDVGEAGNIHPKNKQDVGRRLALWAAHDVYGQNVVYSGPTYKSMKIEGSKIRLTFDHVGGGLVAKDGKLTGFAIAGKDQQFVWADAKIDGNTIIVSSPDIAAPVAVRYGWADNPPCNLYNKAGLPASPFRTDTWPGATDNAR